MGRTATPACPRSPVSVLARPPSTPLSNGDPMKLLRLLTLTIVPALITVPDAMMQAVTQAPTGFDNRTNGHIPQAEFDVNLGVFDEIETIEDGLGPVYNAKGCGVCH